MKNIIAILICILSLSAMAEKVEVLSKNFKFYVSEMSPCVDIKQKDSFSKTECSGFEVELGNAVCSYLKTQGYIETWEVIPCNWSEVESFVRKGEADMVASGITIRSDRLGWCDFSLPTFNSGLGILTLKKEMSPLNKAKILINSLTVPIGVFLIFIICFANIVWITERGSVGGISSKYFPGVFEAFYFCIVTTSTVGYGDYTPKRWIGKVVTVALIAFGVLAFSNFTATLSSSYTVERTENIIASPSDLKGKTVVTKANSTSENFLSKMDAIQITKIGENDAIDRAIDQLLLERADAVVFDYPVLLAYVKQHPQKVVIAGNMFDEQYYGFMLSKDSKFKSMIDKALLIMYEDGTYKTIYNKYF